MEAYDSDATEHVHPEARYRHLKEKISAIKESQGEQDKRSQRKYDNLALLQAQLEHETVEVAQREKIESLKSHLAAVIERTTRIRNAYEKEKKHLSGQVEKLSRERVHTEREHTQEIQNLRESHAAQLASLEGDRSNVKEQLGEAIMRVKQSKVDMAAQQMKLYEQYKKDLQAVNLEHEREMARGEARAEALQAELELSRSETAHCREALDAANARIASGDADAAALRQQCKALMSRERSAQLALDEQRLELEKERHACQVLVDDVSRQGEARLNEYKDRKVLEMEQIHEKLEKVLSKKNASISQLRRSLEQAHLRLAAHEKDFRSQKLDLLDQLGQW